MIISDALQTSLRNKNSPIPKLNSLHVNSEYGAAWLVSVIDFPGHGKSYFTQKIKFWFHATILLNPKNEADLFK